MSGKLSYKKLYQKSYGFNPKPFLEGHEGQDLKIFGEERHFSNIANTQTQYSLLMFSSD